ncbi:hypothetical protein ACJZ2D_015788 [Fusarium nematophilum]
MSRQHMRETSTADLPHDDAGPTILAVTWSLASVSAIFLALRFFCKFKTHLKIPAHILAYSAAADFALAFLPWRIIWNLQMRTKEKIGVGIAMSMGIFAGVASIIKAYELHNLFSGSLYDNISPIYWGTVEAAATIVASSIPVLRVLVQQVISSARQYYLADEATYSRGKLPTRKATVIATNQCGGDDQSDRGILDQAAGGILITPEVSINSADLKDQGSLGGYEMDILDA